MPPEIDTADSRPADHADSIEDILRDLGESFSITIQSSNDLFEYLDEHRDILDLLKRACREASARFSTDDQLILEMFRDRDSDDEYPVLRVRQAIYSDDLMATLEEISESFEADLARASGWMLVTTDFRRPFE